MEDVAHDVTFRLAADGPLDRFTAGRPDLRLAVWCDGSTEVVEAQAAGPADLEALATLLAAASHQVEAFPLPGRGHAFVVACAESPHDGIARALDEAAALPLPPVRLEAGRATYRALAFDALRLRGLFQDLEQQGSRVEVVARRERKAPSLLHAPGAAVGLLEHLTDRQVESLLLAYRHGLYASPRKEEPSAVARTLGISRSTFEEHIRRGEANLMAALVPHLELQRRLRMRADAPGSPIGAQDQAPAQAPEPHRRPRAQP
jgi:predicted DNA binding protein